MLAIELSGALRSFERRTVDTRFHVRGERVPDGRIVIVAVDDETLRRVSAVPPIPRAYYARVLNRLRRAGPRLVVLDVQFIGAEPTRARIVLCCARSRRPAG